MAQRNTAGPPARRRNSHPPPADGGTAAGAAAARAALLAASPAARSAASYTAARARAGLGEPEVRDARCAAHRARIAQSAETARRHGAWILARRQSMAGGPG